MCQTLLRLAVLGLTCVAIAKFGSDTTALAQTVQQTPPIEPRLTVTVEGFCSQTKLRTPNARIRWSVPRAVLDASGLTSLAAARQSLEVTVYKNGFDKGLLASLPVSQATPDRPIVPQAQTRPPHPRAFQISLIEVESPKAVAPDAASEMSVVIENLEPGVNYTWRVAIDTGSGRVVSPPVTSQARVCPADEATTSAPGGKQ